MYPVTLSLSVTGSEGSDSNALRHLRDRLVSLPEIQRISIPPAKADPGTLGGEVVEVLVVLLPASLPVVGSVVRSWINARKGSVTVAVRRDDGTATHVIELRQDRMSKFKPTDLTELVRQALANAPAATPAELPGAPDTAAQAPNTEPPEEVGA
ncbi:hypothetical protein ACFV8Z_37675 [Streptomyces sp. NPDC059837]|uniref:effector-associated constant component EACC1 n=1 Tax=Streptomyces sp. NPDC059837 TaxID=3346968 RepID=UPI00364FFF9C